MKKLIIVVAVVIVLLMLIIGIWFVGNMAEPVPTAAQAPAPTAAPELKPAQMAAPEPVPMAAPAPKAAPKPAIKPRPDPIIDCGYQTGRRGWYDAQNQGVRNDYCRYVGPGAGVPNIWFSCQLAGAESKITMPGFNIDPNSPHDEHDGTRGCPAGGAYDTLM